MDKQVSASSQAISNARSTPYIVTNSTPSRSRIADESDLQQRTDAIAAEMESRNNIAYGVGRMLRNAWDYITENFTLSLPTAEAGSIPEYSSDPEINSKISALHIELNADAELQESIMASPKLIKKIQKIIAVLIHNIKTEFAKAAEEGPETKALILECLDSAKINILDAQYSKFAIQRYREQMGVESFGGFYNPSSNELVLNSEFDGKHNVGTIIHECSHVREVTFRNGENYDVKKMTKCVNNLKKMGVTILKCLDERSAVCNQAVSVAEYYHDRGIVVTHDTIYNPENKATGTISIIGINDEFPKLKKREALIKFVASKDQEIYALELEGTQNLQTGEIEQASAQQKALFKAVKNIADVATQEKIGKAYSRASEELKIREFHASIVGHVPEKVLDKICPDGLGEPPTKKPQQAKSAKFSNPKSKEL